MRRVRQVQRPSTRRARVFRSERYVDTLKSFKLEVDNGAMPSMPLLDAVCTRVVDDGILPELFCVEYAQLMPRSTPDLSLRDPNDESYVPELEYEMFDVPKGSKKVRYVQAPESMGGKYYELTSTQGLRFKLTFTFKFDHGEFDENEKRETGFKDLKTYGFTLAFARRGKDHCYMGDEKAQDNVIVLSVGEFTSNNEFRAWSFTNNGTKLNCVKYQSELLGKKMFDQKTYPKLTQTTTTTTAARS